MRVPRLCEKPGCGAAAEASYGIDKIRLVVWIDALEVAERESAGRLCRRHADALEGPRGWTTDDRRNPVPTLFRPRDIPGETKPADRSRPAKKSRAGTVDTPSLFESIRRDLGAADGGTPERPRGEDSAVAKVTTEVAIDPDETKATPWAPNIGRGAPEKDPTKPVGRLLGRAFGDPPGDE